MTFISGILHFCRYKFTYLCSEPEVEFSHSDPNEDMAISNLFYHLLVILEQFEQLNIKNQFCRENKNFLFFCQLPLNLKLI